MAKMRHGRCDARAAWCICMLFELPGCGICGCVQCRSTMLCTMMYELDYEYTSAEVYNTVLKKRVTQTERAGATPPGETSSGSPSELILEFEHRLKRWYYSNTRNSYY